MAAPRFITEAWACAPADGTVATTEASACISLAAATGGELAASAWTDGTAWSDGSYWADYPYLELLLPEDEAA